MKALKLFLIALLMAGGMTGLMLLNVGGDSEENDSPEQEALYSKTKGTLDEHWSSGQWSLTLFNDDHVMLNKQKDLLGSHYYNSLADQLNVEGNKALYNALKTEFSHSNCNRATIEGYMTDMEKFLRKAKGFEKDKLVKEMQATHLLYKGALALADANFSRTPKFDMRTNTFSPSFKKFKASQLKEVQDIRSSTYFSNISNITQVNNALNSVSTRLLAAEDIFMASLAKQITDDYEKENVLQLSGDSLQKHRDRFKAIRQKFNDEFSPKTNARIEAYRELLSKI